ncbi:MAG: T9SS type A sorting domain-containing protein [Saprospiraceae bacterium]
MNRSLSLALSLLFSAAFCSAQGFQNCIEVLSAAGKTATQGGLTFSYTVGEPVITTISGNTRILTQGFHQPELCQVVSTHTPDLADWNIEVFPNPTADFLTIRFSDEKEPALRASVYNLLGEQMLDGALLSQPGGSLLDCSQWQPGVYILQLQAPSSSGMATVRFIRL